MKGNYDPRKWDRSEWKDVLDAAMSSAAMVSFGAMLGVLLFVAQARWMICGEPTGLLTPCHDDLISLAKDYVGNLAFLGVVSAAGSVAITEVIDT